MVQRFVAVEPGRAEHADLAARSEELGWSGAGFCLLEAAVSDRIGRARMSESNLEFKRLADADEEANPGDRDVDVTTIDSLALNASQRCGIGSAHILVLKIDTEGYDANVLAGARGVLESGRVSFIMFEYINPRYRPRDASQKRLDELTAFLWEFKLGCFLVMDHFLVPVTG